MPTINTHGASLMAPMVTNLPAVQETWVQSLGWEDPLEKGMAIHSSILVWRISWTEEPGGLQSMGSTRSQINTRNDSKALSFLDNPSTIHKCFLELPSSEPLNLI